MATGTLLLLAVLMLDVKLSTQNTKLVVQFAASERWHLILAGVVLVFLVKLFRKPIAVFWH